MTDTMGNNALPPIHLVESEAEWLSQMADGLERRQPDFARLLWREVARAETHREDSLPEGVVRIGARVEFFDEASGTKRDVQLVYPGEANLPEGKISALSPVGLGLIGLSAGQSISWPGRDGRERVLRIHKVQAAK